MDGKITMLYDALVHVPNDYAEKVKMESGVEIFVENKTNDVINTIRHGTLKQAPLFFKTILQAGDEVYFHHNIVREVRDWHGNVQNKMFDFDPSKNLYRCPMELIFAIHRDGKFMAVSPYCFIKPIAEQDEVKPNGFIIKHIEEEKQHYGIVKYGNDELYKQHIREGDTVIFRKDSEYQYNIFGEKLYRMRNDDILAKVEGDIWTGENVSSDNQS